MRGFNELCHSRTVFGGNAVFFFKNERDFSIKYFFKKRLRHVHCYKRKISFNRFAREIYGQPLSHPQEHLGFGERDTG